MISVVVPAYNEERLLPFCLEALKNQAFYADFEVIVIDNGSTDRTSEIAKEFGFRLIREQKRGVGRALRAGCRAARGEIIAVTNADTIVPLNWLAKIEENFLLNPQAVAVGGTVRFFDASGLMRIIPEVVPSFVYRPFYHLISVNMAFRKSSYERVGGFKPEWTFGEDLLLARRLKKEGEIIFDPNIIVYTSARRYQETGIMPAIYTYVSNDLWIYLKGRPLYSELAAIRDTKLAPAKQQLTSLLAKKKEYEKMISYYKDVAKSYKHSLTSYKEKSKSEIFTRKRLLFSRVERQVAKLPPFLATIFLKILS